MDELIKKYLNRQLGSEIIQDDNVLFFDSNYIYKNHVIFGLTEDEFNNILCKYFIGELGFTVVFLNPQKILNLIENEYVSPTVLNFILNYVTDKKNHAIRLQKYEEAASFRAIEKTILKKTSETEV
jgi:hypothetical protein